jgi:uncharacterized protein YraI
MLIRSLLLAALGGVMMVAPAAAAGNIARASDDISVFANPRAYPQEIVGMLRAGQPVKVDQCQSNRDWCRVFFDGNNGNSFGWVPSTYLIGGTAKLNATPPATIGNFGF